MNHHKQSSDFQKPIGRKFQINFCEKLKSDFQPCTSFGEHFTVNDQKGDVVHSRTGCDFGFSYSLRGSVSLWHITVYTCPSILLATFNYRVCCACPNTCFSCTACTLNRYNVKGKSDCFNCETGGFLGLFIHLKSDCPKTAKFCKKMKSMSVLKSMYLGHFLSNFNKFGLQIYVEVFLIEIKNNFSD